MLRKSEKYDFHRYSDSCNSKMKAKFENPARPILDIFM